jgi:sulfite reductase alpha subunit-like flavoprotein
MLLAIVADQSSHDSDAAISEVRELQRAGRYCRDIY